MDTSVFENTCEKTAEESLQNLPLHTGSLLKESSLAAKIAQGVTGGRQRRRRKKTDKLVALFGVLCHHSTC